jgi:hypothetical protein
MAAPMAIPLVAPARLAAFRRFARALALRRAMLAAAVAGWACLTGPALARSAQAKVPARIVTSDGDFPGQLPPFAADTEAQNKPAGADMLAATPALTTTFASALSPEPEPDTAVAIAQAVVQRTVQATPVTALPPDPASAVSRKDQAVTAALRAGPVPGPQKTSTPTSPAMARTLPRRACRLEKPGKKSAAHALRANRASA